LEDLEQNASRRTWVLAAFCAAILVARFSRDLLHAELWAEDGWIFYPDAYNRGIGCLLWPVVGYLTTGQRLGALLTVWVHAPLSWVPTLFAIIGLSAQLITAVFLIGPRLAPLWPDWRSRAAFATLYLALPNSFEVFGTLTNSQWHLQLLAFMILVAPPQSSKRWQVFDAVFLLLSGLSGPFCIMLFPLGAYMLFHYRREDKSREVLIKACLLSCCVAIQAFFLVTQHQVRHVGPLGANVTSFARMVAIQVVVGLLLGVRTMSSIVRTSSWQQHNWPWVVLTTTYVALILVAFRRGQFLLRAFLVYGTALFAAELASPVGLNGPQWPRMSVPLVGERYFVVPMLMLAAALLTLAVRKSTFERPIAIASLAVMLVWAVPHDFIYVKLGHTRFHEFAVQFDRASPGTRGEFPMHLDGGRKMILVKKVGF
jgi:hypothetical protein